MNGRDPMAWTLKATSARLKLAFAQAALDIAEQLSGVVAEELGLEADDDRLTDVIFNGADIDAFLDQVEPEERVQ